MEHSIQRLQSEGSEGAGAREIGRALSRAFYEERNFTYILRDDATRAEALEWYLGTFLLRLGVRYGEVYTTPDAAGAALWMRPGRRVSFSGALAAGLFAMPRHFGWRGFLRSVRVSAELEEARNASAPPRHWYLMLLGVDPARQRQGLGGALMAPVLARADEEHRPCYLETFSERNLAYYQGYGFEVTTRQRISKAGPPFWTMTREPRG